MGLFSFLKREKVNKNQLVSEKRLVQTRLDYAIHNFYSKPSEETLTSVFYELTSAYIYNLNFHVPFELNNNNLEYAMEHISNVGWAYKVCTTPDELVKCPEECSGIVSVRNLLRKVSADTVAGLIINPNNEHNAKVFLNRQNVQAVIRISEEHISKLPKKTKEFILKDI